MVWNYQNTDRVLRKTTVSFIIIFGTLSFHVVTIPLKCSVFELGACDRQTDRQTDGQTDGQIAASTFNARLLKVGGHVLFCSLAVVDLRVGHTMDVLSPFISVLCHSDWLFHRESCPRLDVVHPGRAWSSSPACTWHCSLHYLFLRATPLFPHGAYKCNFPRFLFRLLTTKRPEEKALMECSSRTNIR